MHDIFLQDIPKRMLADIAHTKFYVPKPKDVRLLVLTKDLKLFELKKQNILIGCDLSLTIFKGIDLSNCLKTFTNNDEVHHSSQAKQENCDIIFGKYLAYVGQERKRLFILIQIFDKLVVLERLSDNFKIIEQYNAVERFEIADTDQIYIPFVFIYMKNLSEPLKVDFLKANENKDTFATVNPLQSNELFKNALESINRLKAELKANKIYTRRDFISVKNQLQFGPNIIRSNSLEEKQPLAKYGDVWMKISNNILVIGIPIINNYSKRLTTLENVRVVLISPEINEIEFEYELYCLKDDSYKFDEIDEVIFDNEKKLTFDKEWKPIKMNRLRPEVAAVMILRKPLNTFINCKPDKFQCFICYDIVRNEQVFTLQYFIKEILIDTSVFYKAKYQISSLLDFKDLLAITSTSDSISLRIEYETPSFLNNFKKFLMVNLNFTCLTPKENDELEKMDVDESSNIDFSAINTGLSDIGNIHENNKSLNEIFYHKENDYWLGMLIRLNRSEENVLRIKIYVRSIEKVLTFVQILYKDFPENFVILPDSYGTEQTTTKILQDFLESFRKELQLIMKFCKDNNENNQLKRSEVYEFQKSLFTHELETDLAYLKIP